MSCPCQSERTYESCCGRLHSGDKKAETPEELMRARYCAFARGEIDFIVSTHVPTTRDDIDVEGARSWSENSEWLGIEIVEAKDAQVEFIARYSQDGVDHAHHERSTFSKIDGEWFFADAEMVKRAPKVNAEPKVGRNEPCPCGSSKKYKKCCGR